MVNVVCMAVANWPAVKYMPELTDDQVFGVKSGCNELLMYNIKYS